MYAKLIEAWAKSEGFQAFQADHAAVFRNLAKWLDRLATGDGGDPDQLLLDFMEYGKADCSETGWAGGAVNYEVYAPRPKQEMEARGW